MSRSTTESDEDESDASSVGSSAGVFARKNGPWTAAEDAILVDYVNKHGEGNWLSFQKHTGIMRCGKSCRLRWANHLRPNPKKRAFTPEEDGSISEHLSELSAVDAVSEMSRSTTESDEDGSDVSSVGDAVSELSRSTTESDEDGSDVSSVGDAVSELSRSTTESDEDGSDVSSVVDAGSSAGAFALKKGPWTAAEDAILRDYVNKHGEGNWNLVNTKSELDRCGKDCRLRWFYHLSPNVKKRDLLPNKKRKMHLLLRQFLNM